MDIAVVDDEKIIQGHIREMIENQKQDCNVDCFSSGEEFLAAAKPFDIIFLDIQMDGMNGIDAAKKVREKNADTILIFITGIKEYVFEALDLYVFHYLLKPVTEQKFKEVFEQALREAGLRKMRRKKQLFINTRNKGITIDADNILYIESVSRKVEIHTTQEVIEAYGALGELEAQLGRTFYRCHRGYLVNMAHITEYKSDCITLTGGNTVYLTKKKYSEFVKAYMWYLQNGGASCV
ncbi:MAG: LytTR family DNA-binding domain-containing protein [Acetatifactor sp.]|nr:LytTR family DNA-binding domain-containing protein [Acetatifactor sp.]